MWSYFRIQNRPISNGHGRNTCCAFPEHQLYPEIQSPICGFNDNLDDYNHGLEDDVPGIQLRTACEGLGRPESAQRRDRGGRSPTTTTRATSAGPRPNSTSLRLPALLLPRLELNFLLAEAAINSEVKRGGGVGRVLLTGK